MPSCDHASAKAETADTWDVRQTPMAQVHQHLCAFHVVADDHGRQIEAHHYCTCVAPDFHQCIVYDSNEPTARLIGIEYLISEAKFDALPEEEKVYWHSHKYECESGVLVQMHKQGTAGLVPEAEERGMIAAVHQTFGKVIHTWNIDVHPDLPLGPPTLMMSYTKPEMVNWDAIAKRDASQGVSTEERRAKRAEYLPSSYPKNPAADAWMTTGKQVQVQAVEGPLKS